MLSIILTPYQVKIQLSKRVKERRLEMNLARKTLAAKSGVAESSIKRFENTGEISLDSLLRIASVLDCLSEFSQLFPQKPPVSLYHLKSTVRQRGRE